MTTALGKSGICTHKHLWLTANESTLSAQHSITIFPCEFRSPPHANTIVPQPPDVQLLRNPVQRDHRSATLVTPMSYSPGGSRSITEFPVPTTMIASRVALLLDGDLLAQDGGDLVVHEGPGHVGVLQGALLAARTVHLKQQETQDSCQSDAVISGYPVTKKHGELCA